MHEFTRCSKRVLMRLNQELENYSYSDSCAEEIVLLALLRESGGVAARAFEALGVDRGQLRRDLAAALPPLRHLSLEERISRGMVNDEEQELYATCAYHGTLHDLYMALRDHEGHVAKVFSRHNLTIAQVRQRARQLADQDGTNEGGAMPAHEGRSYDQWLQLLQSDDRQHLAAAALQIMSQSQFLSEEEKARKAVVVMSLMTDLVSAESRDLRWHAVKTLGLYGQHALAAAPTVRQALADQDSTVRIEAAFAIWNITRQLDDVLPVLRDGLRSDDQSCRLFSWMALQGVIQECPDVPEDVLDLVIDNLRSPDVLVSANASRTLQQLGSRARKAVPVLLGLLAQADHAQVSNPAAAWLGMFTGNVSPNDMYRANLIAALGKLCEGSSEIVPALIGLLNDHNPQRQRAALAGLGAVGSGSAGAVADIEMFLTSSDPLTRLQAVAALWKIAGHDSQASPTHVRVLIDLLGHAQPEIVAAALGSLRALGAAARAAIPAVEQLLVAGDPFPRLAAAGTLLKLGHQPEQMKQLLTEAMNSDSWQSKIQAAVALQPDPDEMTPEARKDMQAQAMKLMAGTPPEATAEVADPYEEELTLWDEALRMDPRDAQAYLLRGDVYERAGRREEAVADFAKATELEPDNRSFRGHRAELLHQRAIDCKHKGDLEGAIIGYTEAIGTAPEPAPIYRNRGKAYIARRDYENAFADLEHAHALAPENALVSNDLAWHRATVADARYRDPQRALTLATRACRSTAEADPGLLDTMAVAHAAVGDFTEALRVVDKALSMSGSLSANLRVEIERHRQLFLERQPVLE